MAIGMNGLEAVGDWGSSAHRAAANGDWRRATVWQKAVLEYPATEGRGLWGGDGEVAGRFRLLRWALRAEDWDEALEQVDRILEPLIHRGARARAILVWLTLIRALVQLEKGWGERFRRSLALALWESRRPGSRAAARTVHDVARMYRRARTRGRTWNQAAPVPAVRAGRPLPGWGRLASQSTLSALVEDREERSDSGPSVRTEIRRWLESESGGETAPPARLLTLRAIQAERLAPDLEDGDRDRALRLFTRVCLQTRSSLTRAATLSAAAELIVWCVEPGRPSALRRLSRARSDLAMAAGIFHRLGLEAEARDCEDRWASLAVHPVVPMHGRTEQAGDEPLSTSRPGAAGSPVGPLSLEELRNRVRAAGFVTGDGATLGQIARAFLLSRSPLPILILGESGTGKDVLARAIHRWSGREGEFLAIHCGAIPRDLLESELFGHARGAFTGAVGEKPGLLEVADGGTLFLDEIGEMSTEAQMKMLRVLETGELRRVGGLRTRRVDVRIVAATHRNLLAEVEEGRFRLDLLHRIGSVRVEIPALRERRGDIPQLARTLLSRVDRRLCPVDAAWAVLLSHSWPGNVRELRATLLRAAYLARALGHRTIGPELLGLEVSDTRPLPEILELIGKDGGGPPSDGTRITDSSGAAVPSTPAPHEIEEHGLDAILALYEKGIILRALEASGWNRTRAAASLGGLSRTTLIGKMKRLGIEAPA